MKLLFLILLLSPLQVFAADDAFRSTSLPLPRFVTVKSDKVFVRTGPGKKYPVKWELQRKGLPVEIILEFETWRKIKDSEGDEGWVHQSLLSGKRAGIIQASEPVHILSKDKNDSDALASLEPGVIVKIERCKSAFCRVDIANYKGWVERQHIWGVYPKEVFK